MPEHLMRAGRKAAVAITLATAVMVALIALSVNAYAADKGGPSIFEDAPVAKAPKWTGCYLGILAGYDVQDTQIAGIVDFQAKDFSYGVGAGCDHRFVNTRIVGGIMADYMKSNASNALTSLDGSWSVAARLGFLMSDSTLVYGLAGYTKQDTGGMLAPLSLDHGATFGLGAEAYVTQHLTVKLEYRWVQQGDAMGGTITGMTQGPRVGLNYRF